MENELIINVAGPTDIRRLKNEQAIVSMLALKGEGKLGACMITFYKEGDSMGAQKDLLFLKPLHERSEVLVPHIKDFHIAGYDYCTVYVFTGKVSQSDKITLTLVPENAAQ